MDMNFRYFDQVDKNDDPYFCIFLKIFTMFFSIDYKYSIIEYCFHQFNYEYFILALTNENL